MEEPYGEAVATRAGREPWRGVGRGVLQASAGVRAGRPLSRGSLLSPGRRGRWLEEAASTLGRPDPRQELGAVVPHAGICPGGARE